MAMSTGPTFAVIGSDMYGATVVASNVHLVRPRRLPRVDRRGLGRQVPATLPRNGGWRIGRGGGGCGKDVETAWPWAFVPVFHYPASRHEPDRLTERRSPAEQPPMNRGHERTPEP